MTRDVPQAIREARVLRPDLFVALDADLSLSRKQYQREEAALALAIVYGHVPPHRRR